MVTKKEQAAARVCRIKPKCFLGIDTNVKGNVHYVDDNTLLFPIGRVFVFHDLRTNEQRYMKIPQKPKQVTAVAMAPNRKYITVVEKGAKCTISVFNLETHNRIVILGNPIQPGDVPFAFVSFTCDSQYIVAVTEGAEPTMIYYNITGRVESFCPAIAKSSPVTASVTGIACHPADRTILCLVGTHMFRFINWTDGQWVQYGFDAAEKISATGVCWITEEIAMVGTQCGRLIAIEYADVKGVYVANSVNEIHIKKGKLSHVPKGYKSSTFRITAMAAFPLGFIYSCAKTVVTVFEKTNYNTWVRSDVVNTVQPSQVFPKYKRSQVDSVTHVAVSPSGRHMACTTGRSEVYISDLSTGDVKKDSRLFTKVLSGSHAGRVAGIAICRWKPVVMTIGKDDGCVRIWNYKTKKLLIGQLFYGEKLYGCAFHPTGWYCLLGFKHQLKLFLVTVDVLKTLKFFRIKTCSLMEFSRQGHMFAACNEHTRTVEVYCALALELLFSLKCYQQPATGLHFGKNDQILFATDPCGSVNCWDLQTGEDLNRTIYLDSHNNSVTTTKDGSIYFVGVEGALRQIKDGCLRAYRIDNGTLNTIAIGDGEGCCFVAGETASIFSIEFPVKEPLLVIESKKHNWPIKKLLIGDKDTTLISLDEAGIIGFWKIRPPTDMHLPKFENYPELRQVVVNVTKLSKEDVIIEKQRAKIERKTYQHDYILQHLREAKEKKLETATNDYLDKIEELKTLMKTNEKAHSSQTSKLQQKLDKLNRFYTEELDKQSKGFEADLMTEYAKSEEFKGRIIVNVWDVRRFIKTGKAATKRILEMYDTFMTVKVREIKQETGELRYKKKCLLQKLDRETYNVEKFVNDCIDQYKHYHERRLQKLQKRREYLKDEILFLVKKTSNMENKVNRFLESGNGIFRHLDAIRRETRILKTKNKALAMTLTAVQERTKQKDDLIYKIKKGIKSDVHEQLEKNERLINLKFVFQPYVEAEIKDIRGKIDQLHEELLSVKSRMVSTGLCIATVQRQIDEIQTVKSRQKSSDKSSEKYVEEVREDLYDANAMANTRSAGREALMFMYKKYISCYANEQSTKEFCDGGEPNYTNLKQRLADEDNRTGLEDVVEAYEYEDLLRGGQDYLWKEVEKMRKGNPRPRFVVNRRFGTHAFTRGRVIMRDINHYRYAVVQALELMASDYKEQRCPCESTVQN